MKKQFKKQSQNETQIQWKNVPHEAPFNPTKTWYACVEFDKSPTVKIEYTCRVRSEAVRLFEEEARMMGGKLGVVSAYK